MDFKVKLLNGLKLFYKQEPFRIYDELADYKGQDANDFVYKSLQAETPLMVAKFGTVELGVVGAYEIKKHYSLVICKK